MVNKFTAIGRLTRDVELNRTSSGQAVGNFAVVLNEKFIGKDGEKREKATFTDWQIWGKQGETFAQLCGKGTLVYVEGRYDPNTYEKDGEKKTSPRFTAERFQVLGGYKEKSDTPKPTRSEAAVVEDDEEDDIPF